MNKGIITEGDALKNDRGTLTACISGCGNSVAVCLVLIYLFQPFMNSEMIVVCGGGFMGGHLPADLLRRGYRTIRLVDFRLFDDWFQIFPEGENVQFDLRERTAYGRDKSLPLLASA
jgi:hypothetical protein